MKWETFRPHYSPNCCAYCRNRSLSAWVALAPTRWTFGWLPPHTVIERAVILSNDVVLPNPLPAAGTQGVIISQAATTLRDSERTLILHTLQRVGWVIGGPKGAAAKLGLKRTTLIHKMQKLGISRPSPQSSPNVVGSADAG